MENLSNDSREHLLLSEAKSLSERKKDFEVDLKAFVEESRPYLATYFRTIRKYFYSGYGIPTHLFVGPYDVSTLEKISHSEGLTFINVIKDPFYGPGMKLNFHLLNGYAASNQSFQVSADLLFKSEDELITIMKAEMGKLEEAAEKTSRANKELRDKKLVEEFKEIRQKLKDRGISVDD